MPTRFKIMHTQVGPYPLGRVVSDKELKDRKVDMQHLLRSKAIAQTNEPLTETPLEETAPLIELPPESITNEFSSGDVGGPETLTQDTTGVESGSDDEPSPPVITATGATREVVPLSAARGATHEVAPPKNTATVQDDSGPEPEAETNVDGPVVVQESAKPPKKK